MKWIWYCARDFFLGMRAGYCKTYRGHSFSDLCSCGLNHHWLIRCTFCKLSPAELAEAGIL